MARERNGHIHPGTKRKGVPDISEASRRAIGELIGKRLEGTKLRKGYMDLIRRILILGLAGWLIFTFGFLITQNHGLGMYPALKDGDLCIVFRRQAQSMMGLSFVTGDVIAYQVENRRYMGRIAAVEGDIIQMDEGGSVTVNGVAQSGDILFPTYARGEQEYPLTVPQGCVFVLGDRRTDTLDSRDFGLISLESVEGKVITILRRRGL